MHTNSEVCLRYQSCSKIHRLTKWRTKRKWCLSSMMSPSFCLTRYLLSSYFQELFYDILNHIWVLWSLTIQLCQPHQESPTIELADQSFPLGGESSKPSAKGKAQNQQEKINASDDSSDGNISEESKILFPLFLPIFFQGFFHMNCLPFRFVFHLRCRVWMGRWFPIVAPSHIY